MKKYLLTYTFKNEGRNEHPSHNYGTYDTMEAIENMLHERYQEFGTDVDLQVWEQQSGFTLETKITVARVPPLLT